MELVGYSRSNEAARTLQQFRLAVKIEGLADHIGVGSARGSDLQDRRIEAKGFLALPQNLWETSLVFGEIYTCISGPVAVHQDECRVLGFLEYRHLRLSSPVMRDLEPARKKVVQCPRGNDGLSLSFSSACEIDVSRRIEAEALNRPSVQSQLSVKQTGRDSLGAHLGQTRYKTMASIVARR